MICLVLILLKNILRNLIQFDLKTFYHFLHTLDCIFPSLFIQMVMTLGNHPVEFLIFAVEFSPAELYLCRALTFQMDYIFAHIVILPHSCITLFCPEVEFHRSFSSSRILYCHYGIWIIRCDAETVRFLRE